MDYTVIMDDSMYLECPLIADYVQSIYFLVITTVTFCRADNNDNTQKANETSNADV